MRSFFDLQLILFLYRTIVCMLASVNCNFTIEKSWDNGYLG